MSRDKSPRRLGADTFLSRHSAQSSYKRECQETNLPVGSVPILFCLGIQPNRPIKGNVKRQISPSARCRYFFVSAFSPIVLYKGMSRDKSPRRLGADTFLSRHSAQSSYKRECQETNLPVDSVPILFCLGIQPNRPIKGNVKRQISPSARCRYFFVSAFSPIVL